MTGAAGIGTDMAGAAALVSRRTHGLAETLWCPGQIALVTQVSTAGADAVLIEIAVGAFGELGASSDALQEADTAVRALLTDSSDLPLTLERVHAGEVLYRTDATPFCALVRQRKMSVTDPSSAACAEVLSRFDPRPDAWLTVMRLLAAQRKPLTVRATVPPTTLGLNDSQYLNTALRRFHHAFPALDTSGAQRLEDEPTIGSSQRAWRAERTLVHLSESLASPAFVAEVSVTSGCGLSVTALRGIACCLTSEAGVMHGSEGRVAVASRPLLLGGFDVELNPPGLPAALRHGLPLYGTGPRDLRDLVTLAEIQFGLAAPNLDGLSSLPANVLHHRPVPPALRHGDLPVDGLNRLLMFAYQRVEHLAGDILNSRVPPASGPNRPRWTPPTTPRRGVGSPETPPPTRWSSGSVGHASAVRCGTRLPQLTAAIPRRCSGQQGRERA